MLPREYAWLAQEPGPLLVKEMLKLYGTKEVPGSGDNPEILAWAREIGVGKVYVHDSIPWCGLVMGVAAKRAGKPIPATPLWAKAWANFGVSTKVAMLGDVLVFSRDGGGHVGVYVGQDNAAYHVLGGNQSDQVNITRIAKSRIFAIRRPAYINQPANVRVIKLAANGILSKNEA